LRNSPKERRRSKFADGCGREAGFSTAAAKPPPVEMTSLFWGDLNLRYAGKAPAGYDAAGAIFLKRFGWVL
jgi:hypothetical protein